MLRNIHQLRDAPPFGVTAVEGLLRRPRIGGFLVGRFYAATAGVFSAS